MKGLAFIGLYAGVSGKNDFMIHITELMQIPVGNATTYNDLFKKLEFMAQADDIDPDKRDAIFDWINHNTVENTDIDAVAHDSLMIDPDQEGFDSEAQYYAVFNIFDAQAPSTAILKKL